MSWELIILIILLLFLFGGCNEDEKEEEEEEKEMDCDIRPCRTNSPACRPNRPENNRPCGCHCR